MKKLILILFLTLLLNPGSFGKSGFYIYAVLENGKTVSGEYIESYEDRWFYEASGSHVEKYLLLFEKQGQKPLFHFLNKKQVKSIGLLNIGPSLYKTHLIENNLFFKNHLVEEAHVLTGNEGHHKFEKMFGNFAWDIGIIDALGSQHSGEGHNNSDYYIFDEDVYSPLPGLVIGKVDGQPDNPADPSFTGDLTGKINNYLTIKVADGFYLSLVHFKKDTITVNIGDEVEVDQKLGTVGNSGVSYIPHLHYTLYTYIEEHDRFISVPGFFEK